MANTVRIRFRSHLPGAGFSSSGRPKQGKTNIRGRVEVTSYVKGGEGLTPSDLGLDFVDDVRLTLIDPVTSPDPTSRLREVVYSHSSEEFYVLENLYDFHQFYLGQGAGAQIAAGRTPTANNFVKIADWRELPGGSNLTVGFDAFGDSSVDVELT